jgi:FKBP-type peptidyl-prolyl cis-trans isomerase FkpA
VSDVTAVPLTPVKRAWIVWLALAIAVAALVAIGLAWSGTAKARAEAGDSAAFMAWHKGRAGVITTPSGLQYQMLKPGEGPTPTDADVALINYKGELRDGRVFDQNQRAPLPVAGVVPGFAEALKLMPRGSKMRVWIPPELGYKDQAQGDAIPANSVLIFDIEMIDFRNQAQLQAEMQALQAQQGGQPQLPTQP